MVDSVRRSRKMKDLVEDSRSWDASDLLRNLDDEIERAEQGLIHMIWGRDDRPVTRTLRPLPIAPRFRIQESETELSLEVALPNVPEENMRVEVFKNMVEVYGCAHEGHCRPYYLGIESREVLDPDSVKMRLIGESLEIRIGKSPKKRIIIRSS
jgi:HSP20 family molecular chaperone IbpA